MDRRTDLLARLQAKAEEDVPVERLLLDELRHMRTQLDTLEKRAKKKNGNGGGGDGGGWFSRAWVRWIVGLVVFPWVGFVTLAALGVLNPDTITKVEADQIRHQLITMAATDQDLKAILASIQDTRFTGSQGAVVSANIEAIRERLIRNERDIADNRAALAKHLGGGGF